MYLLDTSRSVHNDTLRTKWVTLVLSEMQRQVENIYMYNSWVNCINTMHHLIYINTLKIIIIKKFFLLIMTILSKSANNCCSNVLMFGYIHYVKFIRIKKIKPY